VVRPPGEGSGRREEGRGRKEGGRREEGGEGGGRRTNYRRGGKNEWRKKIPVTKFRSSGSVFPWASLAAINASG
jgi:hypothetical protein